MSFAFAFLVFAGSIGFTFSPRKNQPCLSPRASLTDYSWQSQNSVDVLKLCYKENSGAVAVSDAAAIE